MGLGIVYVSGVGFMVVLRGLDLRLVGELLRNSRRSDRELAHALGVSQPTVSRRRSWLEKEGLLEYSGVPDLRKLGFDLLAFTFGDWKRREFPDTRVDAAREFVRRHPNLIFLSAGRGMSSDRVAISVHRDYTDYSLFMSEIRRDWEKYMRVTGSFLVSLSFDDPLRSFVFKFLADYLEVKSEDVESVR